MGIVKSVLLAVFMVLLYAGIAEAYIETELVSPQNNAVIGTGYENFSCNMSSSGGIPSYIELFVDYNSAFSSWGWKYLKGIPNSTGAVLIFHINKDWFRSESDSNIYDWSGSGNSGSVSGVTYNTTGGVYFGAYEFNGFNNMITVQDDDTLDLTNEGTIEFWINLNGVSGSTRVVMKGESWGGSGFPYSVFIGSGREIYLWLETSNIEVASNVSLELNEWYHVVATWNCTDGYWNTGDAKLYINNTLVGSLAAAEFEISMLMYTAFAFMFGVLINLLGDIRGIEGDIANGVKTIPVLFGLKNAKRLAHTISGATSSLIVLMNVTFFTFLVPFTFLVSFFLWRNNMKGARNSMLSSFSFLPLFILFMSIFGGV